MMKVKQLRWLSIVIFTVLLAACARHPQVTVTGGNAVNGSVAEPTSAAVTKFTKGPHQGLLGVRQYYFNCNDSLFPASYQVAAKAQASYLKAHPQASLLLQGYSSAAGSEGYNIAIAQQRAESVATYLCLQGVSKAQISLVSMGSVTDLPYSGSVNSKNCRVDLVYL